MSGGAAMAPISNAELAKRDGSEGVFWTAVFGSVYDITPFIARHPGGSIIRCAAGRDVTPLFQNHHPFESAAKAEKVLQQFKIGELADANHYRRSPFFDELCARLGSQLGLTTRRSLHDDAATLLKLVLCCALLFGSYYWAWIRGSLLGAALHGFSLAMVLTNLVHDGSHQGGSNWKWLNWLTGYFMTLVGNNMHQWRFGHIVHHLSPNQHDDPDTSQAPKILRYRPDEPFVWWMRWQHIYAWFLYCLTFTRKRMQGLEALLSPTDFGGLRIPAPSRAQHWAGVFGWGAHFVCIVIVPIALHGWRLWLPHFLLQDAIAGLLLGCIFQVNHITDDCRLAPGEVLDPKQDWAVDQILGSNDFTNHAGGSYHSPMGWLTMTVTGGLCYQIEHHLFPTAAHSRLAGVCDVVRGLCAERGVRHVVHSSHLAALASHYRLLRSMGCDWEKNAKSN